MNENQYQEILSMLTVLYKKVEKLNFELSHGSSYISDQNAFDKLRKEADEISIDIGAIIE